MCDSCSTAISTESNPQDLKVLNHFVLSSVNGEVKRNVLMPNRMSVSSWEISDAETAPVRKALLNHQGQPRDKAFLELRENSLPADNSSDWPDNIWHPAAI